MVAGILEKSNRLRKAFFIVRKLPISRATEGHALTAECGALIAPRDLQKQNQNNLEPKRQRGACRDSRSRRRQPRRFALLDLNSFVPVLRPVSASPAREAARLKLPLRAIARD